jgi:glutamate dehydrogenase
MRPKPLIVTKANVKIDVHRRVYMDYVGVKRFDPERPARRRDALIGLFTSTAYTQSIHADSLYLRRKAERIMARAGFTPAATPARP